MYATEMAAIKTLFCAYNMVNVVVFIGIGGVGNQLSGVNKLSNGASNY